MKHKKVGLALGSGGVRGVVHIGVIKTLLKHNIPIHAVSGSSAGAVVGAYFALYNEVDTLEEILLKKEKSLMSLFFDIGFRGGLISGDKLHVFLQNLFHKKTFAHTHVPLYVIATNLVDGKEEICYSGSIAAAVQGSMSVPVLFKPFKKQNKLLVDGALSDPVPAHILKKKYMDTVIAVNVYHKNEFKNISWSFSHVLLRSVRIALHNLSKTAVTDADVVISVDTSRYLGKGVKEIFQEHTFKKLIALGEREALKALPKIKKELGIR